MLGKVFYTQEDFWPLNTSLWVKEFKLATPTYAFHLLDGLDFERFNAGSAVPTLNRNHVHSLAMALPPRALIQAFENHAAAMYARKRAVEIESATLAKLRDTLLPKLISGKISVLQMEDAGTSE